MTTQTTGISSDVLAYIDQTLESLAAARDRLAQRGTGAKLREIEITLAALALALDLEMEGETAAARDVLKKADWRFGMRYADEYFTIECG